MNDLERDLIAVQFLASNFEKLSFGRIAKISPKRAKFPYTLGRGPFLKLTGWVLNFGTINSSSSNIVADTTCSETWPKTSLAPRVNLVAFESSNGF